MIALLSAQVALFAFAVAILAGVCAGNSVVTILSRALIVMLGALFVSQVVAYTSKAVIRDYLMRRKLEIDKGHIDMLDALEAAEAGHDAGQSS